IGAAVPQSPFTIKKPQSVKHDMCSIASGTRIFASNIHVRRRAVYSKQASRQFWTEGVIHTHNEICTPADIPVLLGKRKSKRVDIIFVYPAILSKDGSVSLCSLRFLCIGDATS